MSVQAKVLYAFSGDTSGGELSVNVGEILDVVSQDVGEGWWEARKQNGQNGYVPAGYLEIVSFPEPKQAPPPPPPVTYRSSVQPAQPQNSNAWDATNSTNNPPRPPPVMPQSTPANPAYNADDANNDDWDGDDYWDSDDDPPSARGDRDSVASSEGFGTIAKLESTRGGFSRHTSTFVKVGGESFLLGHYVSSQDAVDETFSLTEGENGPIWHRQEADYYVTVASPHKAKKFKGIKSFIAYQLTPSFSNIEVSRRYKHFDWLHERMTEKFLAINIPPLPDKQVSGRFEDEFVQTRMHQLQLWMNRMTHHPVIAQSDLFKHFISCTDEKQWKGGKRKAEKDEFVGGRFFLCIRVPENSSLEMHEAEKQVENFAIFLKTFDTSVKNLLHVCENHQRVCATNWKREYEKIGQGFLSLANAFRSDNSTNAESRVLATKIETVGKSYESLAGILQSRVVNDLGLLLAALNEYKGICTAMPNTLRIQKGATVTINGLQKSGATDVEIAEATDRAKIISWTVLGEINHFQAQRTTDFAYLVKNFLKQQIQFYKDAANELECALNAFDQ